MESNSIEAGQDIATPAIIETLKLDFPGFDWEQEKKDFWKGRADVAIGMLPLTLLGLGAASVKDYANSKALLSDDAMLARQGLPENYRKDIIEAAQRGDTATAQRLLQEGFQKRDPAIAAESQQAMDKETDKLDGTVNHDGTRVAYPPAKIDPNNPLSHAQNKDEAAAIQSDLETFGDGWKPPVDKPARPAPETSRAEDLHRDSDTEVRRSRDPYDDEEEPPYWTEYYRKVGRQKDNLDSLISSLGKYNEVMTGKPNHHPLEVQEDRHGASLTLSRDKAGNPSYVITHGPMTKKWELLEEFAHYRARHGWKADEIKAVKKQLDKRVLLPDGTFKRPTLPSIAAEEIVVKQHLLDHALSLSEDERKVLKGAIERLYIYGLRKRY